MMYAFKFTATAWLASVLLSHLILWWLGYQFETVHLIKAGASSAAFGTVFIMPLVWWLKR